MKTVFFALTIFIATANAGAMELLSEDFEEGGRLADVNAYGTGNVSPELHWSGVPDGTKAFAIIVDDPDAPGATWTHWVIYNIPKDVLDLDRNIPQKPLSENGISQGKNDFGKIGYGGPWPPAGKSHRYIFTLYALDVAINIQPGATKDEVWRAIRNSIVGKAELVGLYSR